MGYRSTVGIKCQKKSFELFKTAYELNKIVPDEIFQNGDEDEFILIWKSIKWYPKYEDVEAIENVMDELDAYDDSNNAYDIEMGYSMIRLGESDGDIECRDNTDNLDFYYVRDIDTEGFIPKE